MPYGENPMSKWRKQFNKLMARALDAAEVTAARVMELGKEATSWLKFLLLDKGRTVRNVVVRGITAVAYYSLASALMLVMLGAVLTGVIAVGLLSFWLHLVDAS